MEGPAEARLLGPDVVAVAAVTVLPLPFASRPASNPGRSGAQSIRFTVKALGDPRVRVTGQSAFPLP